MSAPGRRGEVEDNWQSTASQGAQPAGVTRKLRGCGRSEDLDCLPAVAFTQAATDAPFLYTARCHMHIALFLQTQPDNEPPLHHPSFNTVAAMLAPASISASTVLLLLASAAAAQDASTTSPAASPTPTSEGVFTIQTSVPAEDPWACFEECFMEPCPPSPCSSTPNASLGTPVPLPRPISESIASIITDPSLSTVTGFMSIPAGETPISTGASQTSTPASSSQTGSTGSPTSSGAPAATGNAVALNANAHLAPLAAAVAGAFALI
ncbi:hypothetical protein BM1_07521 [Bipolaris maydis]|nr:hypothetical protein BM1_07521 [Bipolaris maydis]